MFEFAAIKSVVVDSSMTQSGGGSGLGLVSVYLGSAWGLCGVGSGFVHDLLRVCLEFIQDRFGVSWIYLFKRAFGLASNAVRRGQAEPRHLTLFTHLLYFRSSLKSKTKESTMCTADRNKPACGDQWRGDSQRPPEVYLESCGLRLSSQDWLLFSERRHEQLYGT